MKNKKKLATALLGASMLVAFSAGITNAAITLKSGNTSQYQSVDLDEYLADASTSDLLHSPGMQPVDGATKAATGVINDELQQQAQQGSAWTHHALQFTFHGKDGSKTVCDLSNAIMDNATITKSITIPDDAQYCQQINS
jgi:hypothetical protein